jgi:hypothetical protein
MINDNDGTIYDFLLIWHARCSYFEKGFLYADGNES